MNSLLQIVALLGLIAVAYIVDSVANPSFKHKAHRLLFESALEVRELRFSNYLDRLFGPGIFTLRSFRTTLLLVVAAYIVIFLGTYTFSPGVREELNRIVSSFGLPQAAVLCCLVATTSIGDYISYAQTRLFLRQAEQSPGAIQSAIFIASDFMISVILFSIFFALAYTVSVSLYAHTTNVTVQRTIEKYSVPLVEQLVPTPSLQISDSELSLLADTDQNAATILASRIAASRNEQTEDYGKSPETNAAFQMFFLRGRISHEYEYANKPWQAPGYVRSTWKAQCVDSEGSSAIVSPYGEIVFSAGIQAGFLSRAYYRSEWIGLTDEEKKQYENLDSLLDFYRNSNSFLSDHFLQVEGKSCFPYTEIAIQFEAHELIDEVGYTQLFNSSLYRSLVLAATSTAYQFRYYLNEDLGENSYGDLSNALSFSNADFSAPEFNEDYFMVLTMASPFVTKDWPKVYVPYSTPAIVSLLPSLGFALFFILKWTRLYIFGTARLLRGFAANFQYNDYPFTVASIFVSIALSCFALMAAIF